VRTEEKKKKEKKEKSQDGGKIRTRTPVMKMTDAGPNADDTGSNADDPGSDMLDAGPNAACPIPIPSPSPVQSGPVRDPMPEHRE
jgi:hypothetical protein